MINIVFCIKSKQSYKRIANTLKIDENFELEDYISNLETLQESISIKQYDLAIIDEKLTWKEQALDLFNKAGTKIVLFKGDFKKTICKIYDDIPKSEIEEEKKRKEKVPDYNGAKYKKISHTEANEPTKENNKTNKTINQYTGIENKLIIICSLSRGAGSTFLTLNLAKALTDLKIRTSIIEPPLTKPYYYYHLNLDEKLKLANPGAVFPSIPHIIDNGYMPPKDSEIIIDDIVWAITDPQKPRINNWDEEKMIQLIYSVKKAPISLVDIGYHIDHKSTEVLLSYADMVLLVINPDPVALKQEKEKLEELISLKKKGLPIEFIINFSTTLS